MDAEKFIITRKRKKYKFARFADLPNCFEAEECGPHFLQGNRIYSLELGAGTGLFSLELARRHPDRHYIAVDVKADRLYTGARQAAEEKVDNISFVRAHAGQLIETFGAAKFNELWLTFPDPYPKKRHAKHRLTHPTFLACYQHLLEPGGVFRFKTDNGPLFEWSLEQLLTIDFDITFSTFNLHEDNTASEDFQVHTTYEQRYRAEGKPIYALAGAFKGGGASPRS